MAALWEPDHLKAATPTAQWALTLTIAAVLLTAVAPHISATAGSEGASATPPGEFIITPPYLFPGTATAVFDYTVTSADCGNGPACAGASEWRLLIGGTTQNGEVASGDLDGTELASGTVAHPAPGETQRNTIVREIDISNQSPGEHAVKAAIRASSEPNTPWLVRTTTVELISFKDADGDGVPDDLERQLCGRPVERDLVSLSGLETGECTSDTDFIPPARTTLFTVPVAARTGPDADGDGFPASVSVFYTTLAIDRIEPFTVRLHSNSTSVHAVDLFDADVERPGSIAECRSLPAVTSASSSDDGDGDGFPAFARATRGLVCIDRRAPTLSLDPAVASWNAPADPDDADGAEPSASRVTAHGIPVNATFGADSDEDGIPALSHLGWASITFDRHRPYVPSVALSTETTVWDPDDDARDSPVPHVKIDLDRDHIPDLAEPHICQVQDERTDLDGFCGGAALYTAPAGYPHGYGRSGHGLGMFPLR